MDRKLDLMLKSFTDLKFVISTIKEEQEKIVSSLDHIKLVMEQITTNSQDIQALKAENKVFKNKIDILEKKLLNDQQALLRNSVNISNIPYEKNENIASILKTLWDKLNIPFSQNDFDLYYRLRRSNELTNTIVVRFLRAIDKDDFVRKAKEKRSFLCWSEIKLTSDSLKGKNKIFINQTLSHANYRLLQVAKHRQKAGLLKYVWFSRGNLYVRQHETSLPLKLTSEEDLTSLDIKLTDSDEFNKTRIRRKGRRQEAAEV